MITIQASIGEKEQSLICDINGDYQSVEEEILIFEGRQKIVWFIFIFIKLSVNTPYY